MDNKKFLKLYMETNRIVWAKERMKHIIGSYYDKEFADYRRMEGELFSMSALDWHWNNYSQMIQHFFDLNFIFPEIEEIGG